MKDKATLLAEEVDDCSLRFSLKLTFIVKILSIKRVGVKNVFTFVLYYGGVFRCASFFFRRKDSMLPKIYWHVILARVSTIECLIRLINIFRLAT